MTRFAMTRRTLFVTAASSLAAPALMTRAAVAQAAMPSGATQPKTSTFKLGKLSITVFNDGARASDKPHETYGTDQKPEAVSALLEANLLPTDRFVNSFSPTLVDTGSERILFDTGLGEAGREWGAGQLRAGLEAAGYPADSITLVVLTHMHGDHIGGLMEGPAPAFPNARYIAGQVEYDFWKDTARAGTPAENAHKGVVKNVVPLAEKTTFIKGGDAVAPGITAVEAFGHSPGHMAFLLESEGKGLMITGDSANHFVLSLQRPDWEVKFDMDKTKAAASRKAIFDQIASDRLPFIGYHMPFPAVGFVERVGEGYRFIPETYQFDI